MDHSTELDLYRERVRQWLQESVPNGWRQEMTEANAGAGHEFQKRWLDTLREGGYLVPHWPEEWGGGMSFSHQVVIYEELARADAPRLGLYYVSLFHAAATLIAHGSEDQKQKHLKAIQMGEIWCQGFSEPSAGSDLASLRTSAARIGNHYIVNGQKIWSSGADQARWCLLLARTDKSAAKHRGISFFLLDLDSPGVKVRPIQEARGSREFCEIFLDNVEVPVENLVGGENDGWRVAQSTLSSERGLTTLELSERLRWVYERYCFDLLKDDQRREALLCDDQRRRQIAAIYVETHVLRNLVGKLISEMQQGRESAAAAPVVKVYYSELLYRYAHLGVALEGLNALALKPSTLSAGPESGGLMYDFIGSWGWTIGGGTNEIMRNIIAERGLGLPRLGQS